MMRKILMILILSVFVVPAVSANQYPTEETVRYVLDCMMGLGGQTEQNFYTCICRYDVIRSEMSYAEYEEGKTYERNKPLPGEKGAFFRDNKRGERFYKDLLAARTQANKNCIVVQEVKFKRTEKK